MADNPVAEMLGRKAEGMRRWINGRLLVHGKLASYTREHCTCTLCRAVFTIYQRQRRADMRAVGLSARGREIIAKQRLTLFW